MAAKGNTVKSIDLIEDEVTCLICKGIYCDPDPKNVPKKLPCDHIFCLQCLQRLILRSIDGTLNCPTCRATSSLKNFDASLFPTAHPVNRLIDIYRKTLEEQAQETPTVILPRSPQHPLCSLHSSQPLALYCVTCQKTVCRDCVILLCASEKHNYGFLEELAKKYKSELDEKVKPLRDFHQQISTTMLAIAEGEAKLEEQKKEELKSIEDAFEIISHKIKEQKRQIISEAQNRYENQSVQNFLKVEELRGVLKSLSTAIETTENPDVVHNMPINKSLFLEQKQQLQTLHSQTEKLLSQPKHVCELNMKLECLPQQINAKSVLFYHGTGFKCCLGEYDLLKSLKLKQPFKIDFQLVELRNEAKIKSRLTCMNGKSSVSVNVTKVSTNTIRLSATPQARGQHELHILFCNSHICGSPIPAFVYHEPHQLQTLKPKLIPLEAAAAIKCNDNTIIIGSVPSRLNILEYRQQSLTVTKKIQCRGINEFAIHNNYLYYSDVLNYRLVKADMNGKLLASTGEKGSQPGQFEFPNGVQVNNDQIFVSDSDNGRIQVFDTDLNFLRTIGEKGDGPGQFKQLNDVAFDEDGNMYVVEYLNHRVQVLTPQGDHIRFIGTATAGRCGLKNPVSLAIFNGHIYVTDTGKNCISVYTQEGTFVTTFGEGDCIHPECIDIDNNGFVYVTSNRKYMLRY